MQCELNIRNGREPGDKVTGIQCSLKLPVAWQKIEAVLKGFADTHTHTVRRRVKFFGRGRVRRAEEHYER